MLWDPFELHGLVDANQMGSHNMLFKRKSERNKKHIKTSDKHYLVSPSVILFIYLFIYTSTSV